MLQVGYSNAWKRLAGKTRHWDDLYCVEGTLNATYSLIFGGTGVRGLTRLGYPPPKVDPGAFSCQRPGWKTPKRTLWQCTASVCVAGVHCWEISLGLADPGNVIFRLVLSIYPRIFLCVFIVYRRVVRILCLLLYSVAICWCVLVALV